MKFTFEFGRRGQHSVRKQNEALLLAMEAMAQKLTEEQQAHEETRKQLREALEDRLSRGHRMRQGFQVVSGGQARFQLER